MKTRYILLLLIAVLLVQGVAALDAGEISIGHDKDWITAGTTDKATLTVTISNASVQVTGVTFAVESGYTSAATFGTTQKVSDTEYRTTFWSTKSGSPIITTTVAYSVGGVPQTPVSKSFVQNVDHAAVYDWQEIVYTREVSVYTPTTISVKLKDKYGNLIDNRRETAEGGTAELVAFSTSYLNAGFWDGTDYSSKSASIPVNNAGIAAATFRTASIAGSNPIDIRPPLPLTSRLISITGIGNPVPASITPMVYPSTMMVPANGVDVFVLNYQLKDLYGNPCPNSPIRVTTSLGEEKMLTSNELGEATMWYGPRNTLAAITVNAISTLDPTVRSIPLEIRFISEEGSFMIMSVSPTNMGSFDVLPFTRGVVRARVVDLLGRGVAGETISFRISDDVQSNAPLATVPKISLTQDSTDEGDWVTSINNIVTDDEGYAIVYFRPGGFPVEGEEGYEPFAIGNCTVEATWDENTETTPLISWRNYPYLRVETEVSNSTVRAGETFDVTIRLIGDGHELEFRYPIDVVLTTSRAATMLSENDDRMVEAFRAQETFLSVFENSTPQGGSDRIAIASFAEAGTAQASSLIANVKKLPGDDGTQADNDLYIGANYLTSPHIYAADATIDIRLDSGLSLAQVKERVDETIPWSSDTSTLYSSPLRMTLYESIKELRDHKNPKAVRAVVVLLDSSYKWYGDPTAYAGNQAYTDISKKDTGTGQIGGPWYVIPGLPYNPAGYNSATSMQNMTYYALSDDIMIFIITVGSTQTEWNNPPELAAMDAIANPTGGFHVHAESADQLSDYFDQVAQNLIRHAGVNTTMSLQFVKFDDPENALNWSASELLDYVPADPVSTSERFFNWSASPYTPLTTPSTSWYDQSEDWYDDYSLHFEPGTIAVKQTWETKFRMRVNPNVTETLNFSVFGPLSRLYFENQDGEQSSITLPDLIVTVVPGIVPIPQPTEHITVSNLSVIDGDSEFLWFNWDVNYTGEQSILQTFEYRTEYGNWNHVRSTYIPASTTNDGLVLPVRNLQSGMYYFRVKVSTSDAGIAQDATSYELGAGSGIYYIRIE